MLYLLVIQLHVIVMAPSRLPQMKRRFFSPSNLSFLILIHLLLKNFFPSSLILLSVLSYLFSSTIFSQILKPCSSQLPPCFFLPSPSSPLILRTLSEAPMVSEDSEPDLIDLTWRWRRWCHFFVTGHNLVKKTWLCFLLPYHAVGMYIWIYPVYHFWNYFFPSNISANYFIRCIHLTSAMMNFILIPNHNAAFQVSLKQYFIFLTIQETSQLLSSLSLLPDS